MSLQLSHPYGNKGTEGLQIGDSLLLIILLLILLQLLTLISQIPSPQHEHVMIPSGDAPRYG